jgi:hypothetical protein
MICLLYNDVLCLALGVKMDIIYDIHACINLNRARMETADSGRGEKGLARADVIAGANDQQAYNATPPRSLGNSCLNINMNCTKLS